MKRSLNGAIKFSHNIAVMQMLVTKFLHLPQHSQNSFFLRVVEQKQRGRPHLPRPIDGKIRMQIRQMETVEGGVFVLILE
jgi:hypothetical protein